MNNSYDRAAREALLEELRVAELEAQARDAQRHMALLRLWRAQGRPASLLRAVASTVERDTAAALGKPYSVRREVSAPQGRLHVKR